MSTKRFISLLLSLIFTLIGINSAAAEHIKFEEYKWGSSKEEVSQRIHSRGHKIELEKNSQLNLLKYRAKILKKPATVQFLFTPRSKKLVAIKIKWEDENIGKNLKPIMCKKYGSPRKLDSDDEYVWRNLVYLDFSENETICIYYSNKYYMKQIEEVRCKRQKR